MARQNYQQGKRQREIAKKQKQDRKMQRRQEKKNPSPGNTSGTDSEPTAPPAETES